MLGQGIVEFCVTRNGLLLSRFGIEVNVVSGAGAQKNTPLFADLLDESLAFHMAIALT